MLFRSVLTALALVRATVHPVVVITVIVCAVWANRQRLRWVHRAAVVVLPALVFTVLVVKNLVLVGVPSLTSWQGMNVLRSTQPVVPQAVLDEMVAAGDLSGVAAVPAFSPIDAYTDRPCTTEPGVLGAPTYDDPLGRPPWADVPFVTNFNSPCFVPFYEQAGHDGVQLIVARPHDWLTARRIALRTWFTT